MSSTLLVRVFSGDPVHDRKVAGAHVRVAYDTQSSEQAYDDHITDAAGNVAFMFTPDGPKRVHVDASGYADTFVDTKMPRYSDLDVSLTPLSLPRLTLNGTRFYADGRPVFLAGASAFLLYRNYLDGQDVTPFLRMLRQLGAKMVRVFGMAHYIPVNQGQRAFRPQDYGDRYYDEMLGFYKMLDRHGLYGLWTNFPDNGFIMPALGDQLQHHDRTTTRLRQVSNALYELTNEMFAHDFNRVEAARFPKPIDLLSCVSGHGEEFGGNVPPGPHWDFASLHPPRRYPSHIKDCCVVDNPTYLALGKGVLLGEPDRFGSRGNTNADQARMSAGASRETALGIVFHSAQARDGTAVFDDLTMRCAEAFFGALR